MNHLHSSLTHAGAADRLHRFISFKTIKPICFRHRWARDALIVATLDRSILAIAPADLDLIAVPASICCAYVALTAAGSSTHFITSDRHGAVEPLSEIEPNPIVISRQELLTHPHLQACREIWHCRHADVSVDVKMNVLLALDQHPDGIALSELTAAASTTFEAVLSMAASGRLAVDLDGDLGPWMVIHPMVSSSKSTVELANRKLPEGPTWRPNRGFGATFHSHVSAAEYDSNELNSAGIRKQSQ